MKRISDIVVPRFLKQLDAYLLKTYPTIWETRIHFVLFYGLMSFFILFLMGMLHPVSITNLTVDPIAPIDISDEIYYTISALFALIVSFFWGLTQRPFSYRMASFPSLALRMALYGLGLFVLFGLDSTAYRLGMIYRTAHAGGVMSQADYEKARASKDYRYGFVMPEQDNFETDSAYFVAGEALMDTLCNLEDTLLAHRYDDSYFIHILKSLLEAGRIDSSTYDYLSVQLDLSGQSELTEQSDMSYQSGLSPLSYWPSRLYRLYRPSLPYRLYRSYLSEQSALPEESDRSYLSGLSNLSDSSASKLLSKIRAYKEYPQHKAKESALISLLGFNMDLVDTVLVEKDEYITMLEYPFQLEETLRSIEHAQQYLREWIVLRYFKNLLCCLPMMVALFFSAVLMGYEKALGGILIYLLAVFTLVSLQNEWADGASLIKTDDFVFALPLIGFLLLIPSIFQQRQTNLAAWAFHFTMAGVLMFLLYSLFLKPEQLISIRLSNNFTFFGVSAIGVLASLLAAYLSRFPKEK